MSWDHERVQELLAGYALKALDGDEHGLAEQALAEHLPACETCRSSYEGFREVAGDLALAAPPTPPPDTLAARVRRAVRRPAPTGRWSGWVAAGIAVALVGALSGWNLSLTDRLSDAEAQQRWLVDAIGAVGGPDAGVVPLEGEGRGRIQLLISPGSRRLYVVGSGMPRPEEGVYHVWLVGDDRTWSAGSFVPHEGVVMLRLEEDPSGVEQVMVTHEAAEDAPTPTTSPVAQVVLVTPAPSPSPTATATAAPSPTP